MSDNGISACTAKFASMIRTQNGRLMVLDKVSGVRLTRVLISFALLAAVSWIIAECLMSIYKIMKFYLERKARYKVEVNKSKFVKANAMFSSANDNETYINKAEDAMDVNKGVGDYAKVTKSIQSSLDSYKTYNQKIAKFYKATRDDDNPPDTVDRRIFDGDEDNY